MKSFIAGIVVAGVLAIVTGFVLDAVSISSAEWYSTEATRL